MPATAFKTRRWTFSSSEEILTAANACLKKQGTQSKYVFNFMSTRNYFSEGGMLFSLRNKSMEHARSGRQRKIYSNQLVVTKLNFWPG